MYKVLFSETFETQLKDFLSHLKQYYFTLYQDTGIVGEKEIIKEYQKSFDLLYNLVKNTIEEAAQNGLLGRKILEKKDEYELCKNIFYVRSYRISFQSKKDNNTKVIYIESLNIAR